MSATCVVYKAERRPSLQPKVVTDDAPLDEIAKEPPMLLSRLRGEWTAIRSSTALLRKARSAPNTSEQVLGTVDYVTKEEMVKVYTSRQRSCNAQEDAMLVEMSLTEFFDRADFNRNGKLGEVHWLHDGLLQSQAPSLQALQEVNTRLKIWLLEDALLQSQLLDLFLQSCEGYPEPWLTPVQMRRVAERWISQGSELASPQAPASNFRRQQSVNHLRDLLSMSAAESDSDPLSGGLPGLSYYDYLTHMLACRKARVQLWHYDLSYGRAKWLSALVGQELTGVWHTSIVVYNKEYWYGGRVLVCEPGGSPFGSPDKIMDLPGLTTRTDVELLKFLRGESVCKFREDNYDVLANNCNHFTDAICVFLLNRHLPEDVLRQPALKMGARAAQIMKPLLNNVLGGFGGKSLEDDVNKPPQAQDACSQLTEGNIVLWEFKEGWTRVARVVAKAQSSVDLLWLNTSSGELRLALGVEHAAVHCWKGSSHEAMAHMPRRVQDKPCPKRRLRSKAASIESRRSVISIDCHGVSGKKVTI